MSDIIRAIVSFFTAFFMLPSLIFCGTDNINDNVYGKVKPDTWVAVDGLGRSLPTYEDVGETDNRKFVGLFYWTWHYNFASEFVDEFGAVAALDRYYDKEKGKSVSTPSKIKTPVVQDAYDDWYNSEEYWKDRPLPF